MCDDKETGVERDLQKILSRDFSYASDIDKILQSIYVTDAHTRETKSISPDTILSFERVEMDDKDVLTRLFIQDKTNNLTYCLDVLDPPEQILSQLNGAQSQAHLAALEDVLTRERQANARRKLVQFSRTSEFVLKDMNVQMLSFLERIDRKVARIQQQIDVWEKGRDLDQLQKRSESRLWQGIYRQMGWGTLAEFAENSRRRQEIETAKKERESGKADRQDIIASKEAEYRRERDRLERMSSDPQMSEDDRGRLNMHLLRMSDLSELRSFRFVRQTEGERERYIRENKPEMSKDRERSRTRERGRERQRSR